MKKISVQELKPGSVLGREVVSREGVVLLEKGGRLTKTAIATLLRRDVPFVYVEEQTG
jgi:hypothetical protein